jgi:hypothetical protein
MTRETKPNRRQVLSALGALPALGAAGYAHAATGQQPTGSTDGESLVSQTDRLEYARLKTLDREAPDVIVRQQQMPTGKIGDLQLGRLISGSNLISINMHARDLAYVNPLARHYNTEERIFMTLKLCEEHGVNAIILKNHNFRQLRLARYWNQWGGRMQWIADVITTDINQFERLLVEHLDLGASAAYLWGGASDIWYHQGKQDNILKAFEIMKSYGIPVGIGAHRLEPIAFCEKQGLVPDFYMLTLHHDRYWSAHPEANRRFNEMYEPNSPHHDQYHDNMFCHDHEQIIAFMQEVKVPWIAFKVLAAGAIPPKEGIDFAFHHGADFVCLGMFDFQVRQDVQLVQQAIASSKNRSRPWMG